MFARREPWQQAGKYLDGLASDLPRKNGWTLAEPAGDATPDKTQRLLNHASWDHQHAMGVVRGFVVEHLADPGAVVVIDESGQEKAGAATVGADPGLIPLTVAEVKRLYNLLTRTVLELAHHLRWAWWRRRHQARARWFHHRARLQPRASPP